MYTHTYGCIHLHTRGRVTFCRSVLQYVHTHYLHSCEHTTRAVCCIVLQCVAVCCSVLQWGTACCSKSTTKKLHSASTPHMPCVAATWRVLQQLKVFCSMDLNVCTDSSTPYEPCVAVCCSVVKRVAVCCSVLQYVAVFVYDIPAVSTPHEQCVAESCSVLQSIAEYCSVLQCVAVWCGVVQRCAVCCIVSQCLTVCCSSVLQQCVALYRSVLQCVAACIQKVPGQLRARHTDRYGIALARIETWIYIYIYINIYKYTRVYYICIYI